MAYKEIKLDKSMAKALSGGWNDGVGKKPVKKSTPKKSTQTKKNK